MQSVFSIYHGIESFLRFRGYCSKQATWRYAYGV